MFLTLSLNLLYYSTGRGHSCSPGKSDNTLWNADITLTPILKMKTYKGFIRLTTKSKEEIVNITAQVQCICQDSGVKEGFVLVFPHHTSSAVYISDSDTDLTRDYQELLRKLIPEEDEYAHNRSDPKKNAAGHLKSILTGHHIILPLAQGQLDLGPYQTIYYAEFDGMREKEILVKVTGQR